MELNIKLVENGDYKKLSVFELWDLEDFLKKTNTPESLKALEVIKSHIEKTTQNSMPFIKQNVVALEGLKDYDPMTSKSKDIAQINQILDRIEVFNEKDLDPITKEGVKEDLIAIAHIEAQQTILKNEKFATYKNENAKKGAYTKAFVNSMQKNLMTIVLNEELPNNQKDAKAKINSAFAKLLNKKSSIKITNTNFIGAMRASQKKAETFANKFAEKTGLSWFAKKAKAVDEKLTQKYPVLYTTLKSVGMYTAAGFIPGGVAMLTAYNLGKAYQTLENQATENGTSVFHEAFKDTTASVNTASTLLGAVVVGAEALGAFKDVAQAGVAYAVKAGFAFGAAGVAASAEISKANNIKGTSEEEIEQRKMHFSKAKNIGLSVLATVLTFQAVGALAGQPTPELNTSSNTSSTTTVTGLDLQYPPQGPDVEIPLRPEAPQSFEPNIEKMDTLKDLRTQNGSLHDFATMPEHDFNETETRVEEAKTEAKTEEAKTEVKSDKANTSSNMKNSAQDVIENRWMTSQEGQAKLATMKAGIEAYNLEHGTNISVHDMARDGFVTHYTSTDATMDAKTFISDVNQTQCDDTTTEQKYRNLVNKSHLMKNVEGYSSQDYSAYKTFLQTGEVTPEAVSAYLKIQDSNMVSEQGHWMQDIQYGKDGLRANAPCLDGNAMVTKGDTAILHKDGSKFMSYVENQSTPQVSVDANQPKFEAPKLDPIVNNEPSFESPLEPMTISIPNTEPVAEPVAEQPTTRAMPITEATPVAETKPITFLSNDADVTNAALGPDLNISQEQIDATIDKYLNKASAEATQEPITRATPAEPTAQTSTTESKPITFLSNDADVTNAALGPNESDITEKEVSSLISKYMQQYSK